MATARSRRRGKGSKVLSPTLERAAEKNPSLENENESGSLSLDQFGTAASGEGSRPLSTSTTDDEFERVASQIESEADTSDAEQSPEMSGQNEPSENGDLCPDTIKLPVLKREHIELGLRFGHHQAAVAGWGDHWELRDWQATILVPAIDNYLRRVQGKVESLMGDWLTRFAGENTELCVLLGALSVVYGWNIRETIKLRSAGKETDSSTTDSPASSDTSASPA